MGPYLDTRFLGALLVSNRSYQVAWELLDSNFAPPFYLTAFQALRLEHMLLHQTDATLKVATLRGRQEWRRHLEEGVFQLSSLDWDGAHRLALDLNRRSLHHRVGPFHYFEAASASMLEASHFLSFDPFARMAAKMVGIPVLPES